ncbi:DUF3152 domain-containing protein [Streptomyces sp. AV19]|nr:DUF3152 domain-containing protein [Streptomyces sp. AV19]
MLSVAGGASIAIWQNDKARQAKQQKKNSDALRSAPQKSVKPSQSPSTATVPSSGPGTFTTAHASGRIIGKKGQLRLYKVQVEDGTHLSAEHVAAEIQKILTDPRSWAAHGQGRFQPVSGRADITIKIATPHTTDKLCAPASDTGGELSCKVADDVIVNLKRWVTGSPEYDGLPGEYRHLIINQEVGYLIGYHMHMYCPGPGRLAPVMMQQIKGLHGCKSNAWPYTRDGDFITGPLGP